MIEDDASIRQWYAVYTKPSQEILAEENLKRQGYEIYFPRIKQERRRRGTWVSVIGPLFPRYIFVKMEQGKDNFAPIRSTFGVSDLVRFGGMPKALSHTLIMAIKARENCEQGLRMIHRYWQPGIEIEVTNGPFTGFSGIFVAKSAKERVVILLRLLGRENRVIVTQNTIVPV